MFKTKANQLLNYTTLWIDHKPHRLVEIEFYWTQSAKLLSLLGQRPMTNEEHKDPFTHCSEDQLTDNQWYFHESKKGVGKSLFENGAFECLCIKDTQAFESPQMGKSYKGGTYKGLDLTFSHNGEKGFGGILIRSIQKPNNEIIEGPCKVVDYILEQTNNEHIKDLVAEMLTISDSLDAFVEESPLYLELETPLEQQQIYLGPRVGLTLKKGIKQGQDKFIMKPYRYLIFIEKIKKYRHTVICAFYWGCKRAGGRNFANVNLEMIKHHFQIRDHLYDRYVKTFQDGKLTQLKDYVKKSLKSNDILAMYGLLIEQDAKEIMKFYESPIQEGA